MHVDIARRWLPEWRGQMTDLTVLVEQGAMLMVTGMVIVFAILGLLVLIIELMAKLIRRFVPEPSGEVRLRPAAATSPQQAVPPAELAAITAAVHQHRRS